MKLLALSFLMLSSSAFACWNMKATLTVDGAEVKFDQKINHDQTYSFMKGGHIFNVKMPSDKNRPANIPVKPNSYLVMIDVQKKEALSIKTVSTGMILATVGQEATMIKGETGSGPTTTFKVTVTEI